MPLRSRLTIFGLVLLVAVASGPTIASAHLDPPGKPLVEVEVRITGVATSTDHDDGVVPTYNWDAELEGDYTVTRGGIVPSSHAGRTGSTGEFDYDWDAHQGRLKSPPLPGAYPILYRHVECGPIDPVTVDIDFREDDSGQRGAELDVNDTNYDDLGSGSVSFARSDLRAASNHPNARFDKKTIDTGKAKVRIEFVVITVPDRAAECADPRRQPTTRASSSSTNAGSTIYDWQFANLLKHAVGSSGYANIVMIFDQCYGGGMLDDLSFLEQTGDVAAMAAAAFDQKAKMDGTSESDPQSHFSEPINDALETTGSDSPTMLKVASAAARDMESGKYQRTTDVVRPQFRFYGRGKQIQLGKKTDGSAVKSRHAVLFAGDADHPAMWRDLDRAYASLTKKHGFPADDVHVLFDAGKQSPNTHLPSGMSSVPAYVDGPGTKGALTKTMRQLKDEMNDDEQLVIWMMDHGNSESRSAAKKTAVRTPEQRTLESATTSEWSVDEWMLADARADPSNRPYVSLIVQPATEGPLSAQPPEWTSDVGLRANDRPMELESVTPVLWADETPDVDGYELVYPVAEHHLAPSNTLAVDWTGSTESFEPYTISMVQLSIGDIAKIAVAKPDPTRPVPPPVEPRLVDQSREHRPGFNDALSDVPFAVRRAVAGERIRVVVQRSDGLDEHLGIVTDGDGQVSRVHPTLDSPTIVAWTDGETADRIAGADDPMAELVRAVESDDIEYRGTSLGKRFELSLARFLTGLF